MAETHHSFNTVFLTKAKRLQETQIHPQTANLKNLKRKIRCVALTDGEVHNLGVDQVQPREDESEEQSFGVTSS